MNIGGWELQRSLKGSTKILIYSNLEGSKSVFVKAQHCTESVILLSAHRQHPLLLYSSQALRCIASHQQSKAC